MDGTSLAYLLIFVSTMLVVLSTYNYFAKERVARLAINRRLSVLDETGNNTEALNILRQERGIFGDSRWPALQALRDWLIQTGLRFDRWGLFFAFAAFTSGVTTMTALVMDFELIAFPIGAALSIAITAFVLRFLRARRIAQFGQQLPEVLEIIVRSLRSGHPLPAAFALVAKESRDPAGSEFGMAFDEIAYGLDVTSAIKNLSRRVGDPDLVYVVTSIAVQSESGGNLSEILARLSTTIRERQKLRLKIAAMTAEGRLSGAMLTALPLVVFLLISWISPEYFGAVWEKPAFVNTMRVAGLLLIVGHVVMKRLVNFKF